MEQKPAYIPFFEDMFLALECLEDAELRKALAMFRHYYFDGEEPDEEKCPARAMFLGFKASMDASLRRIKANRANGHRKAKPKPTTSEPRANKGANRGPDDGEVDAKRNQTEPNEANAERIRSRAIPKAERTQDQPQAKSKPRKSQPTPKTDKTKDQGPKTKDQEDKSVGARLKPPPPIRPSRAPNPPRQDSPEYDEWLKDFKGQVSAYGAEFCQEHGLPSSAFDADRFVDHFSSNGWKVSGRAPMKDWKASVRNWIKNDHPNLGGGAEDDWAAGYEPDPDSVISV